MFGTKTRYSFSFACKMICYSRTSHQTIKSFLEGFAWRQAIVLLFLIQKLVLRIWTKNSFSITTSKNIFFPFTCIYFWWVKDTLYAALSHLSHEIIWLILFVYTYMRYFEFKVCIWIYTNSVQVWVPCTYIFCTKYQNPQSSCVAVISLCINYNSTQSKERKGAFSIGYDKEKWLCRSY